MWTNHFRCPVPVVILFNMPYGGSRLAVRLRYTRTHSHRISFNPRRGQNIVSLMVIHRPYPIVLYHYRLKMDVIRARTANRRYRRSFPHEPAFAFPWFCSDHVWGGNLPKLPEAALWSLGRATVGAKGGMEASAKLLPVHADVEEGGHGGKTSRENFDGWLD